MNQEIDFYSIAKDLLKNWLTILLFGLAAALIANVYISRSYAPQYSSSATLFVTNRGTANSVYDNQYSASNMATKFEQILNSNVLKKKVAEEVGLDSFAGSAAAELIPETNLITVSVTAGSPGLCFKLIQSILRNYNVVSDYLTSDAILETIQSPEIPYSPDNPLNVRSYMEKAFLLAVCVMCLLLGLLSFMKDTIRSEKDIKEKLDTRHLGTIWHENKHKTLRSWIKKTKGSILISNPLISFRYVESMKKFCRKTRNVMDEKKAKIVLVTSVLENEGKSTVAANLALGLSQSASKVLLIDCDFRKPSQYKVLNMQNEKIDDLGEILNGKKNMDNLINKVPGSELYAVLNTVAFDNSTEMITTGLMKKMLHYLKDQMDYIVIDTAPTAMVADAEEMMDMVDGAILVTTEHLVEAKDLNDTVDVLNGSGKKVLGCVLNNAHNSLLRSQAHGYGYGYGYGYGGHYEQ